MKSIRNNRAKTGPPGAAELCLYENRTGWRTGRRGEPCVRPGDRFPLALVKDFVCGIILRLQSYLVLSDRGGKSALAR